MKFRDWGTHESFSVHWFTFAVPAFLGVLTYHRHHFATQLHHNDARCDVQRWTAQVQ